MDVRKDPGGTLYVSVPVYETQMQLKLMRFLTKEVQKLDGDATAFVEIMNAILTQHPTRVQ